jgi:spore coat protein A
VIAHFDREGRYVWHCHILSHEDHEMMRPYYVGPMPASSEMAEHRKPVDGIQELVLRQNAPNPFQASTGIGFALPEQDRVALLVYDIQGRRVRTLVEALYPAGIHTVTWDGRDDRGQDLPSGVYFYDLKTATESRKMKMIKIQ